MDQLVGLRAWIVQRAFEGWVDSLGCPICQIIVVLLDCGLAFVVIVMVCFNLLHMYVLPLCLNSVPIYVY